MPIRKVGDEHTEEWDGWNDISAENPTEEEVWGKPDHDGWFQARAILKKIKAKKEKERKLC